MVLQASNDIQKWEAFKNGDVAAYALIYSENVSAMYRYGMSLSSLSEFFVFDCIHDVFTEIWSKKSSISTPDNIKSYLFKSLKNRMQNQILRRESKFTHLKEDSFDELWEEAVSQEQYTENIDSLSKEELIHTLITQLPPRQQEALKLRFIENLEFSEIADIMSINRQSAQNLVLRAVEKLRKSMFS